MMVFFDRICFLALCQHISCLTFLCRHFAAVAAASHANKMTAKNLAIVLTPSIFPTQVPARTSPRI
jgi:hypothetical protein